MHLLKSIISLRTAITVLAKHHGDSIVIFHLEIVIFHISIIIFHISGGVGWGGVPASISALKAAITVLVKHHGDCRGFA